MHHIAPRESRSLRSAQNDSPDFLDALNHLPSDYADVKLFLLTAGADRKKIAEISSVANAKIYSDPDVQHGSERWIRRKWNSVQKYRHGLTIDAFGLPPVGTVIAKMTPVRMPRWAPSRPRQPPPSG